MKQPTYGEIGYSLLLKALGNSPKLRLIDIFLTNPYFDFTREELVRELAMSKQTLYKIVNDLQDLGVVVVSRKIGRATLYKINRRHPLVTHLHRIILDTSDHIAEQQTKRPVQELAVKH